MGGCLFGKPSGSAEGSERSVTSGMDIVTNSKTLGDSGATDGATDDASDGGICTGGGGRGGEVGEGVTGEGGGGSSVSNVAGGSVVCSAFAFSALASSKLLAMTWIFSSMASLLSLRLFVPV